MQRKRDRTRHTVWSKEERAAELLRMRAYDGSRVASETADERRPARKEWRFFRLTPQCFAFASIKEIYRFCE